AGRRDHRQRRARYRLSAHRYREEYGSQDLPQGPGDDRPDGLSQHHRQQPGLLPGGRKAGGHRRAAPGAGTAGFAGRAAAHRLDEYEALLSNNPIWLDRTKNVGVIDGEQALRWALTGPSLRGSGVNFDIRKAMPYSGYEQYDFEVPLAYNGDVYDRYLVRMQ